MVPLCNTAFASLLSNTAPTENCAISAGCCRSSGHLLSDRHAKRKQVHAAPLALETQLHERRPRHSTDLIRWASFGRILAVMSIVEPGVDWSIIADQSYHHIVARPPARLLTAFSTSC